MSLLLLFPDKKFILDLKKDRFHLQNSSQQREEHLSVSENECYEDGDGIYTALSALLDEITTHEICPLKEREQ